LLNSIEKLFLLHVLTKMRNFT